MTHDSRHIALCFVLSLSVSLYIHLNHVRQLVGSENVKTTFFLLAAKQQKQNKTSKLTKMTDEIMTC